MDLRHGFCAHSGQSIHVGIERKPGMAEFTFEDDGIPFNPLDVPPPRPYTSLEKAKIGGLGVSLVTKYSTQLRYERPAQSDGGPWTSRGSYFNFRYPNATGKASTDGLQTAGCLFSLRRRGSWPST